MLCPRPQEMLESQQKIIGQLRIHAASTPSLFQDRFIEPITAYANLVANLPGSASSIFSGEGGLFRAGLEMGFNAFRASDGRIFTGSATVEQRHLLEERWRYVCFAAGLLYPIGIPLQSMQIAARDGAKSADWSPELDSLIDHIGAGNRYWVTWLNESARPGPSGIAGMVVARVLGRKNIDWLNAGSPDLIRRLVEVASAAPAAQPLIAYSLIQDVWNSVSEREGARQHQNYGRLTVGTNLAPYVVDAMVALTNTTWKLNERTLFADAGGAYLTWPEAGKEIIEFCKGQGYAGIPTTESALLNLMQSQALVDASVDGVSITEIANAAGEIVAAVKLAKPGLLIEDLRVFGKPGARPVQIDAVVNADPLSAPSPEKPRKQPKAKPAPVNPVDRPTLDTLVIEEPASGSLNDDDDDDEGDLNENAALPAPAKPLPTPVVDSRASTPTPKAAAEGKPEPKSAPAETKVAPQPNGFKEGEEVSYASYVPPEIAERLKRQSVEILGKVIHTWKNNDGSYMMRRTSIGAAVEQAFILQIARNGVDAVIDWGSQGLLYIDPGRPGVKIHKIATTEGGQSKVDCAVFSNGAATTLGLN